MRHTQAEGDYLIQVPHDDALCALRGYGRTESARDLPTAPRPEGWRDVGQLAHRRRTGGCVKKRHTWRLLMQAGSEGD